MQIEVQKFLTERSRRAAVRIFRSDACRRLLLVLAILLIAAPLYAQGTGGSPWENAVQVLQTAFTSTIARGLSLVAIVVGGLMFAFGEGQSKRVLAGIIFGVGVAEVNDVGRDAKTQEPFGRVFFTKGKSLIFYAYDLDRQDGQRKPNTFQAWGRRGHSFSQALPLGIMYLDSSAKRRWVLRLDDPSTLAKIDAVFVTVEPSGGSEKPTGKPLLFAYLKIEPNHP